jgi:hypothetical protein
MAQYNMPRLETILGRWRLRKMTAFDGEPTEEENLGVNTLTGVIKKKAWKNSKASGVEILSKIF